MTRWNSTSEFGRGRDSTLPVFQCQDIIYVKGFGVTSVEDGALAITPEALFRIGSTTKPQTETALMRLVEDGLLDPDTIGWRTNLARNRCPRGSNA